MVWLCGQLDPAAVLGQEPTPLSQMVLLSLVQQLASDLSGWVSCLVGRGGGVRVSGPGQVYAPTSRPCTRLVGVLC